MLVIGIAVRNCWRMRLDKRAVTLGVAAVAVAVVLGALAGAVAGVVAALAGLAPAVLWQVASGRQAVAGAAADSLAAAARDMAPQSAGEVSPAGYLRPEAAVVSFWPREELDWLRGWLASGRRADVALVTGQAGAGKTRLALRLTDQLKREFGWRFYWVPADGEERAVRAARQGTQPVLVVCDYAEARPRLAGLLAGLLRAGEGPVVRVLLLARSAGEWWQQLIAESDVTTGDILASVQPVRLGPLAGPARQEQVFEQALAAFAAKLGTAVPPRRLPAAAADAVALVVHAAALLAVLDSKSPDTGQGEGAASDTDTGLGAADGAGQLIDRLLRHETRYWERSQARYGLSPGLGATVTSRAVAAAALVGADDEESAVTLLTAVADLTDTAVRGRAARWLHDLYPAEPGGQQHEWIGPLRPDLIAETLIVNVLSGQPSLTRTLLTGLSAARATRALTILARAALTTPAASTVLGEAISNDPAGLVIPAMGVAVETNPRLGDLLASALEDGQWPVELLWDITRALPETSTALSGTAATAYRLLAESSTAGTREHSRVLLGLSHWLAQLGRQEEALVAIEQAVTSFQELARSQPDTFLPNLATSLNNQANLLRDLGRPEEALAVILEAVGMGRQLAAARPDEFTFFLAGSLANLAVRLADLGRREDALAASQEATGLYRQLAAARPDEFNPRLANTLELLASDLSNLGRQEDALAVIEQAVTIHRHLATSWPVVYAPRLESSLLIKADVLASLGRESEADSARAEAAHVQ